MWFTESYSNKIGRITTSGTIIHYSVPTGNSNLTHITSGPDGALWFTEQQQGRIGRITTSGNITEYPLASGSRPNDIVEGPDGALWYTDAYQSTIGRITVGGITPYDTGSFTSNVDIVAGLDGNLWFTSTSPARQITRMTLSGELTPYPIEPRVNARFHPLGELTVGSDGAIWFTDASYSSIGRITTAGLVTRFTILGYSPYGIHAGPDGAIWFGLSGVSAQLGRITPSGTSSLYGTTGIGGIAIFTFGSDLAIWFISGDKIGRYVPGSPLAGVTALKRQVLTRNVPK